MIDVDDEQNVGQAGHLLDTAEAALEFFLLATEAQHFFLGQAFETALFGHLFERHQTLDRLANGLVVGEHAAKPAVADERHFRPGRMRAYRLPRRALGADKEHFAAIGDRRFDKGTGFASQGQATLEIDDVDLVSLAEDVGCHLRVPVAGLVTKMHASL